ncbi:aminoglycoside 3'-phosphotransferase [Curtobacterium sp. MCBD17_013]|uniref:aminoglycoside 3'-phosphotransferase n=1 Tax=Curtobacterium sp. MCBD17_013 TaxID=2175668 RepID=UPI0021AD1A5A|nr:aminoglycoside 3'-phosphotransferase [Curtobacterium sp. MCBD17_013]
MLPIAGLPQGHVDVPECVSALAAGRTITAVWRNDLDGRTFRLGEGPAAEYVKWAPHGVRLDLLGEIARLSWAGSYTPVPRVVDHGEDPDGRWLRTVALPGRSAVDPRFQADPRPAVIAAGHGLRALHDALPVADCPFEWSVTQRIARSGADDDTVAALGARPEPDRIVVCHGDPCTPNTIVGEDGQWVGHVDLDTLGIADRWADIAVATMALGWNFGDGWESLFLDAYGIAPDPERTRWYRTLWNLGDGALPRD